jgi:transcriptional regulator with XRE-family HTH domain
MKARRAVGWNVRRLRAERGFSIESLAGEAEVDESHVARIERGTVNPSVDVLERLAQVLKVKLSELFIEPEPGTPPPPTLKRGRKPQKRSGRRY